MLLLGEIGLRLGTAAAGVGSVVLAVNAGDDVTRLVAVLLAIVFLGPLVVLLVTDVREWLGRPPPAPDPAGRPTAAAWGFVVVLDGVVAGFVYAGVLDLRRGGSGELLAAGLMVGLMVVFLNGELLGRRAAVRRWRGSNAPQGPASSPQEPLVTPPPRLVPLLEQFDFARERLTNRLAGPVMDSGDGTDTKVGPLTDEEFFWEPVPGCWSVRRRVDGPGPRATMLAGARDGDWGRDAAPYPHPWPPPFTTIAWRLSHISEMLTLSADHTAGSHTLTRDDYRVSGNAAAAVAAFDAGAAAWREALAGVDDAALDTVGYCTNPHSSAPEDPFIDVVWWVNQELLHHGAEIALLRDLYRERATPRRV